MHIYFAELLELDPGSALQDTWIAGYRARWAAHRAAASVTAGDGGAWLDGDKARAIACDAMIVPVVMGDIDPDAVEELIALCVRYHRLRTVHAPADGQDDSDSSGTQDRPDPQDGTSAIAPSAIPGSTGTQDGTSATGSPVIPAGLVGRATRQAQEAAAVADILAGLEQQILAKILQVVSGPGGVASFLRRNLLGKGLNGPSLPLDVGQP